MRARLLYVVALLVAVAGLGAFVIVPSALDRAHDAAIARARQIAAALRDPAGAVVEPTGACHGVGAYRCLHVDREAALVADELADALRAAAGRDPERGCDMHPGGPDRDIPMVDCTLSVATGRGHYVFVFVHTMVRPAPKPRVDGSQVGIYAD